MRILLTVVIVVSLLTSCFQISWAYKPITIEDFDISADGSPTKIEIAGITTCIRLQEYTFIPTDDSTIWISTKIESAGWDTKPRYPHRMMVMKWNKSPRKPEPAFLLIGVLARPLSKKSYVGVGQVPIGIGAELRGWDITEEEFRDPSKIPVLDFRAMTEKCPHDCFHCFTDKNPRTLTLREIQGVVAVAADMGTHAINYLGEGEPTIDPWFKPIIEYTHHRHVTPVIFTDAATKLRDPDMVKWLYDWGATICPKCDSLFNPVYQNWVVRDNTGKFFDQRNKALEVLIAEGFNTPDENGTTRLGFDMVVSKKNIHEVPETLRFCRENNLWIIFAFHLPTGRSGCADFDDDLVPTAEQKTAMQQAVAEIDAEYGFNHEIYSNFATHHCVERTQIYGDGRVSPCTGNETIIGNVQEVSLWDLHARLLELFPRHHPEGYTGHCLYREPTICNRA